MIFEGNTPKLHPKTFVAQGAIIIGRVAMKEYSSVWFNAVVRGDINHIQIGRYSNIQDNCVIHVADDCPVLIGDYVTVGHHCNIHGATIEDHCQIGMGAIVLNHAVVGQGSIIAAGAVVKEGEIIPPHSLVAGVPGRIVKVVPDKWDDIHAMALKYANLWTIRYGLLKEPGKKED